MTEHHTTQMKYGYGRKTLRSYIIGFVLSFLLTLSAFIIVGKALFSPLYIYLSITILALLQLLTQLVFFLRMTASKEGRWPSLSFVFTILIIVVLVFGSLWIMYNLNYNMVH